MRDWRPIETAPHQRNIEVAVRDRAGTHILETPCLHRDGLWIDAKSGRVLDIHPTHWREYE